MMLVNPYRFKAPIIPPVVTQVGSGLGTATGSSTKSITGITLGTAVSKRVYCMVSWWDLYGSAKTVVSATIAGVAATTVGYIPVGNGGTHSVAVIAADIGTATTGDISVTLSGATESTGDRKASFTTFTVSGQAAALAAALYTSGGAAGSGTTTSANVSTTDGGFVLGMIGLMDTYGATISLTGITEFGSDSYRAYGMVTDMTGATLSVGASWTGSTSAYSLAAFSFKP